MPKPRRKAPKRPKPKKAKRRLPVKKLKSQALVMHGSVLKPTTRLLPSRGALIGLGAGSGLGTLLVGGIALATTAKVMHDNSPAPPFTEPRSPNVPAPPPLPPSPPHEVLPEESWSDDNQTLNTLSGFHRAKQKEINKSAVARVPDFLSESVGPPVHLFEAGGTQYAAAVEMHSNPSASNPLPHPHKGISVFIKDGEKVTRSA